MKKTRLVIIFMFVWAASIAQYHNAAYLEAGGTGLLGTLNFDSRTKKDQNDKLVLGWRIGVGASPKYFRDPVTFTTTNKGVTPLLLLGVNTFFDPEYSHETGHNVELGANLLFAPKNSIAEKFGKYKGTNRIIPSLNLGFRSQGSDSRGFMWRLCYTPYFLDHKIRQMAGISAGYYFN